MAFWQISRFSQSPGEMLIIESVINNGLGYVGMSTACTWLMRRSVRKPFFVEMTRRMNSSVDTLPFMSVPFRA